jgi:hypothetical protein
LQLNNTAVTDKGLAVLTSLKELRNTKPCRHRSFCRWLMAFKGLPNLETMYLYQTNVNQAGWPQLKSAFPKTVLDPAATCGYPRIRYNRICEKAGGGRSGEGEVGSLKPNILKSPYRSIP